MNVISLSRCMGWAMVALCFAANAAAQSEQLRKAVDLFDKQEYAAAHELFLKVDKTPLSEAEKAELDAYLKEAPLAVSGAARAREDKEKADAAAAAGNWSEADALYKAVVDNKYARSTLRDDAAAQRAKIAEKRRAGEAMAPAGGGAGAGAGTEAAPATGAAEPVSTRKDVVQEMRDRHELLWQRAVARMQDSMARAREAAAAHDYKTARELAQTAGQLIEEARAYADPASKYESAKAEVATLKAELDDAFREYSATEAERERKEIGERIRTSRRLQEEKRAEEIEKLFNSASQLRKEMRFDEAAEMLRQILLLDPSNAKARAQLEVDQDWSAFRQQERIRGDFDQQMRRTFMDADDSKIPWQHEVLYPSNWLEMSNRRKAAGLGVTGEDASSRELNRRLENVMPESRFQDVPFEQVVEYLQEVSNVNINVDWEDLTNQGIEKDKLVSLKLNNVSFRTVLKEILTQVGGDVVLAYSVSEGLIRVASKEKLDREKEIRVYDINDLLVNIPRFTNAANLNPAQALNQAGQSGQGGGGGSSQIFDEQENENQRGEEGQGAGPRGALVQQIMDIIRQTVEPDSWRETGAGDGSIRELNGQLIVYNTADSHRQVGNLLAQLREFRALQIAIESRFLTVSSNFLEEIGVDLDFVFNSGSADFDQAFTGAGVPLVDPFTGGAVLIPRQYSRIGNLPNRPAFGTPFLDPTTGGQAGGFGQPYLSPGLVPDGTGIPPQFNNMTPIAARQGSLNLVNPANVVTGVPGSFADAFRQGAQPAMQIAGSFLDNLQVDFLIRATQANSRSSIVQAPRLVLFNGQRANIFVGRSQTYVASLQPQIAQQAAAFQPIIGVAASGSSLDVEATISADRRYVTVTVQTTRAQDPILTRFEIQRASGNAPGAFVTTVDQLVSSVNTTVSIPDGGTVLLGGLKQVGEVEIDAGVPILSKIPILKRAFTNTTTIKDTQTLLILMKAKIIIQKEAEEEAFPQMLSASAG